MPAMNFGQLLAQVRVQISEPVQGFWLDVDLKTYLNDGYADLAKVAKLEAGPTIFSTVAQQESYNVLPVDFWAMRLIERETIAGTGIYTAMKHTTPDNKTEYYATPGKWFIYAGLLWLVPAPDNIYKLRMWYHKSPPAMVLNADLPAIDADYHNLIWVYATARAKQRADDPAYSTFDTLYESGKAQYASDVASRHQSESFDVVQDDWRGIR